MNAYVVKLGTGLQRDPCKTVHTFDRISGIESRRRREEYLERAIERGSVIDTGQYIVCVPNVNGLNVSMFQVEEVPNPRLRIIK